MHRARALSSLHALHAHLRCLELRATWHKLHQWQIPPQTQSSTCNKLWLIPANNYTLCKKTFAPRPNQGWLRVHAAFTLAGDLPNHQGRASTSAAVASNQGRATETRARSTCTSPPTSQCRKMHGPWPAHATGDSTAMRRASQGAHVDIL